MKNLSTNRILMVCGLLVAAGCVFFAFSGVEEKTAGPSINYLQPNAMSHAHSGFSNSGRNIENTVSYKTAIETKTAITSTTGYQPISSSTLEPSRSTFGTSFSGSNTVSSYSNASMATNITSVVATNGSLTTSTDNVTSDHQLAEPFSDAPVNTTTLYRLPGDPSEPFPDPEAPVGTGMAFLCLCATAYGVVKFKKSKNNN